MLAIVGKRNRRIVHLLVGSPPSVEGGARELAARRIQVCSGILYFFEGLLLDARNTVFEALKFRSVGVFLEFHLPNSVICCLSSLSR